ncbi:MAG: Abi family protein [Bacteroides sp.]
MKKLKTHASLSEQVLLLEKRGLEIEDRSLVEKVLFNVNYYRLSGYLHNFKEPNSDHYTGNLSWYRLKRIYDFDRKLTRMLMYALEDIEETLKTRLSYVITSHHPDDPAIYLKPYIYNSYSPYTSFLSHFYCAKENNRSLPFVKHHNEEYGGLLPMWVAVELLTMGNLHAIYDNLITKYKKELAKTYGTGACQLSSWIENLTYTRNHLAHYMRIYNFNFGRTPAECKNHRRTFPPSNMIFDQIFIISCMYSDVDEWNNYVLPEIKALVDEYEGEIELSGLGFTENWASILTRK